MYKITSLFSFVFLALFIEHYHCQNCSSTQCPNTISELGMCGKYPGDEQYQDILDELMEEEMEFFSGPYMQYYHTSHSFISQNIRENLLNLTKYITGSESDDQKPPFKTELEIPSGCPFRRKTSSLKEAMTQEVKLILNCSHTFAEIKKKTGKCVDESLVPNKCKLSGLILCDPTYKYRTIDGSCNNLQHPKWGKSDTPFFRKLPAVYADDVSVFRTSLDGNPLPNPRVLSQELYSKSNKRDLNLSMMYPFFGLFLDHDIVETTFTTGKRPCCSKIFDKEPEKRSIECLQLNIPVDDPFYGPKNVTCLPMMRTLPILGKCIGRREQLNRATSYIDGSIVYGSNAQKENELRAFNKGELKTQEINHRLFPILAQEGDNAGRCGTEAHPLKCFDAGDYRISMVVALASVFTLMLREHNRIAATLSKLNPQWDDETLYQEARKIVGAEIQLISYREFLPMLLGNKAIDDYKLRINENKRYNSYDPTVDASTANVFSAAAFRFGHSLVQGSVDLIGQYYLPNSTIALHKTLYNLSLFYNNEFDLVLRGLSAQKAQLGYVTKELRNHLFQPPEKDFGYDLEAFSILRGRDHGLPSYTKWQPVCGLPQIRDWDDLYKYMEADKVDALRRNYRYVDDIDMIAGGLQETPVKGSLVGPTYHCIIARQFRRLREGDRFWFEDLNQVGSFTEAQLKEIYHSSLSRIICDNSDGIKHIQKFIFLVPSGKNPLIKCDDIPKMDLTKWKYM